VACLERDATRHGVAIGTVARGLLDEPLSWTRMRRVQAFLGLVKRYGAARLLPLARSLRPASTSTLSPACPENRR